MKKIYTLVFSALALTASAQTFEATSMTMPEQIADASQPVKALNIDQPVLAKLFPQLKAVSLQQRLLPTWLATMSL